MWITSLISKISWCHHNAGLIENASDTDLREVLYPLCTNCIPCRQIDFFQFGKFSNIYFSGWRFGGFSSKAAVFEQLKVPVLSLSLEFLRLRFVFFFIVIFDFVSRFRIFDVRRWVFVKSKHYCYLRFRVVISNIWRSTLSFCEVQTLLTNPAT
jgi:hypothetical protein